MNRRSFFATLFAPVVARWMPKPDPDQELSEALKEFRRRYIKPAVEKCFREWAREDLCFLSGESWPKTEFGRPCAPINHLAQFHKLGEWKPQRSIRIVHPDGAVKIVEINT
jgi:hypothetical protein